MSKPGGAPRDGAFRAPVAYGDIDSVPTGSGSGSGSGAAPRPPRHNAGPQLGPRRFSPMRSPPPQRWDSRDRRSGPGPIPPPRRFTDEPPYRPNDIDYRPGPPAYNRERERSFDRFEGRSFDQRDSRDYRDSRPYPPRYAPAPSPSARYGSPPVSPRRRDYDYPDRDYRVARSPSRPPPDYGYQRTRSPSVPHFGPERSERSERSERLERLERPERPERPYFDNPDRDYRGPPRDLREPLPREPPPRRHSRESSREPPRDPRDTWPRRVENYRPDTRREVNDFNRNDPFRRPSNDFSRRDTPEQRDISKPLFNPSYSVNNERRPSPEQTAVPIPPLATAETKSDVKDAPTETAEPVVDRTIEKEVFADSPLTPSVSVKHEVITVSPPLAAVPAITKVLAEDSSSPLSSLPVTALNTPMLSRIGSQAEAPVSPSEAMSIRRSVTWKEVTETDDVREDVGSSDPDGPPTPRGRRKRSASDPSRKKAMEDSADEAAKLQTVQTAKYEWLQSRTESVDFCKRVYAENQRKALLYGSVPMSDRIYRNVTEHVFWQSNIDTFERLRPSLAERIAKHNIAMEEKAARLRNRYKELYDQWQVNVTKLERITHRQKKKQQQREQAQSQSQALGLSLDEPTSPLAFSSRISRRGMVPGFNSGDLVRTEAEFMEILASLEVQEMRDPNYRASRTTAVIPNMIIDKHERQEIRYDDSNLFVQDPLDFFEIPPPSMTWSEEEKAIFARKYVLYPKQFGKIASFIEHKSAQDCVLYYYRTKRDINYKALLNKKGPDGKKRKGGRRKGVIQPSGKDKKKGSALLADLKRSEEDDDDEDDELDSPRRSKKDEELKNVTIDEEEAQKGNRRKRELEASNDVDPKRQRIASSIRPPGRKPKGEKDPNKKRGGRKKTEITLPVVEGATVVERISPVPLPVMETMSTTEAAQDSASGRKSTTSSYWSVAERSDFLRLLAQHGKDWIRIAERLGTKTQTQVRNYYQNNADKLSLENIAETAENRLRVEKRREDGTEEGPEMSPPMGSVFESSRGPRLATVPPIPMLDAGKPRGPPPLPGTGPRTGFFPERSPVVQAVAMRPPLPPQGQGRGPPLLPMPISNAPRPRVSTIGSLLNNDEPEPQREETKSPGPSPARTDEGQETEDDDDRAKMRLRFEQAGPHRHRPMISSPLAHVRGDPMQYQQQQQQQQQPQQQPPPPPPQPPAQYGAYAHPYSYYQDRVPSPFDDRRSYGERLPSLYSQGLLQREPQRQSFTPTPTPPPQQGYGMYPMHHQNQQGQSQPGQQQQPQYRYINQPPYYEK